MQLNTHLELSTSHKSQKVSTSEISLHVTRYMCGQIDKKLVPPDSDMTTKIRDFECKL